MKKNMEGCQKVPLVFFLVCSTGLKWIKGIDDTSCIGCGSIKIAFFLSHPAPSKYNPFAYTPVSGGCWTEFSSIVKTLKSQINESIGTSFWRAVVYELNFNFPEIVPVRASPAAPRSRIRSEKCRRPTRRAWVDGWSPPTYWNDPL